MKYAQELIFLKNLYLKKLNLEVYVACFFTLKSFWTANRGQQIHLTPFNILSLPKRMSIVDKKGFCKISHKNKTKIYQIYICYY